MEVQAQLEVWVVTEEIVEELVAAVAVLARALLEQGVE